MTSERHTGIEPGVGASPGLIEATAAVTAAWGEAGWPQPLRKRLDYRQVQRALVHYLRAVFAGRFSDAECQSIVTATLTTFMAPLHAGMTGTSRQGPEELVSAVRDAALDANRKATGPRRSSDERDTWLTHIAFGVSPDQVRDRLKILQRRDESTEFLIVTQYLDLGDLTGEAPPAAEVAAKLNRAVSGGISEERVRKVLSGFGRAVRADEHASR